MNHGLIGHGEDLRLPSIVVKFVHMKFWGINAALLPISFDWESIPILDNSCKETVVSATIVGYFCEAFAPGWKLVHAIA